jgi:hypothetical protein
MLLTKLRRQGFHDPNPAPQHGGAKTRSLIGWGESLLLESHPDVSVPNDISIIAMNVPAIVGQHESPAYDHSVTR